MNKHKHYDLIIAWAEGRDIEVYSSVNGKWLFVSVPTWNLDYTYRTKLEKPSIDWDHVRPNYVALAVDEDGEAYLYTSEPYPKTDEAWGNGARCVSTSAMGSFKAGNCHWRDSLVTRPKG